MTQLPIMRTLIVPTFKMVIGSTILIGTIFHICRQVPKRGMVAGWWWYNAIKQNTLIDKLTWFLFTTFTVSKDDGAGKSAHFFDYLNLLQFYADKSVKDLARKITFDNSMLYYLDNGDPSFWLFELFNNNK